MMRKRMLYGALLLAACSKQIGPEEPSGATPATGQSGRAFSVEMDTIAEGPMPWLGSSNLVVESGTLTLSAMAAIGQGIVPYSIRPRTSTGGGFDSTITIEAEVPVGAQLIVGRGRLRDSLNQTGIGVIVAPSSTAGAPTSFLVGLGIGKFEGASAPLACGGTPLGRSTLVVPTPAGPSAVTGITSPDLGRQTIALPDAPQLALLSNSLLGGHGTSAVLGTLQTLTFKFEKVGDGVGSVSARQADTNLFATTTVDASTMEGRSLACKLSWATCEAICASSFNALFVFGRPCAPQACRDGIVKLEETTINPEPGDFSGSETCRQGSSCNSAPAETSAVTQTAKTAIREVFRNSVTSNEILLQLVRNRSGLAPRIHSITVDR